MAKKIKATKAPGATNASNGFNQQVLILFGVIAVAIIGLIAFVVVSQQSAGTTQTLEDNVNYKGIPLAGKYSETRDITLASDVAENVSRGIMGDTNPDLTGIPYIGDLNAPIIIGELADFTCPTCMSYADTTHRYVQDFVRSGDALFLYMPFPLPGHEPNASYSARAAMCAAEQGGFWEMHDEIFRIHKAESAGALTPSRLEDMANDVGLDGSKIRDCMNTNRADEAIANARRIWNEVGATGTPTLVYSLDGGKTWQGIATSDSGISGALPYETVASLIRSANQQAGG